MSLARHFLLPLTLSLVLSMDVVAEDAVKDELTVPSAEVIKSFLTTAKEKPDGKTTFTFNVSFKPAVLPAKSMELYRSKGKIPFAIAVELLKTITTADGPEEQNVFEGAANIVVVDAEGKIVSKKQEDLSALCPSWTGAGGYLGEVTKAGTYKAFVWMVFEKKTFGRVLELTLK